MKVATSVWVCSDNFYQEAPKSCRLIIDVIRHYVLMAVRISSGCGKWDDLT